MHEEIVIGGFDEQGVLFVGQLLAKAALQEGHEVVYMPSCGVEERGDTVWCDITISDEQIGALFITRPTVAIAMTPNSLVKFEPAMKPEGLLVVNQSLIQSRETREDISSVHVPASDLAMELGDNSVSSLVALGALLADRPVVSISSIMATIDSMHYQNQECLEVNKR
ncbi:MAG: 2-oxoacid:acceptor oxidoreductase family protein, partial [Chloroflexota bacterium]